MHFNILRQSGRFVYAYFKIYLYMPNFASIGRVDLVSGYFKRIKTLHFLEVAVSVHQCSGGMVCILDSLPLGIFLQ